MTRKLGMIPKFKEGEIVLIYGNKYKITYGSYVSHPELYGYRGKEQFMYSTYPAEKDIEELNGLVPESKIRKLG